MARHIAVGKDETPTERKVREAIVRHLGTCTIAEITIDFTTVEDLAEHHAVLPITVNVVLG